LSVSVYVCTCVYVNVCLTPERDEHIVGLS